MKKRKQLDALVSNGKAPNSKRSIVSSKTGSGSCSAHELLKHDTDSSDMEDFSILQSKRSRKKHHRLHISTICLPLCQFVLITTCILVSGTLLWLHIDLREDFDIIRSHLQKVEAGNRNTPEALHATHDKLKHLDSNLTKLHQDFQRIILEINNATSDIRGLKDISGALQASIEAAPAIKQLPKEVNSLEERVATFGSKIATLESNVKELKDSQTAFQNTAQNLTGELDSVKTSVQELANGSKPNATSLSTRPYVRDLSFQTAIEETRRHVSYLQKELTELMKSVDSFNSTINNQMSALTDLSLKVDKVNEALIWNINDTHNQNTKLFDVENYVYANLTLGLTHLEKECAKKFEKLPIYSNSTAEINKIVNQSLFHIMSSAFNPDLTLATNRTNSSRDLMKLMAGLLNQFPNVTAVDSTKNIPEVTTALLNNTGQETTSMPPDNSMNSQMQIPKSMSSILQPKLSESSPTTSVLNDVPSEDTSTQLTSTWTNTSS